MPPPPAEVPEGIVVGQRQRDQVEGDQRCSTRRRAFPSETIAVDRRERQGERIVIDLRGAWQKITTGREESLHVGQGGRRTNKIASRLQCCPCKCLASRCSARSVASYWRPQSPKTVVDLTVVTAAASVSPAPAKSRDLFRRGKPEKCLTASLGF